MQIIYFPKQLCKAYDYAIAHGMFHKWRELYEGPVRQWKYLREKYRMSFEDLSKQFGFSRATFYRRLKVLNDLNVGLPPPKRRRTSFVRRLWGEAEIALVLQVRRENPTYGKAKIAVILKRDHGVSLSESTVGRILKHLMEKGKITRSISATHQKRRRIFDSHAQKAPFKPYKDREVGEMMQIDHMSVSKNGIRFKQFQAYDRSSKFLFSQIFCQARSSDAKKFLLELISKAPFKVKSIQVDGGSEFMGDFEKACEELGIPLYVLPPATPKYNGGVERANKIMREEFYGNPNLLADTLTSMRVELQKMLERYNCYRPHNALNGLTPMMYLERMNQKARSSHLM